MSETKASTQTSTEERNPNSRGLDTKTLAEVLGLIQAENEAAASAVGRALHDIRLAADDAVRAISSGGRVFYAGAGTSGRLGVLDAAEIPPTFGRNEFQAFIAGGQAALSASIEGAEDDGQAGAASAVSALQAGDMALGIAASGRTPFVIGFLMAAKELGARTWLLSCQRPEPMPFIDNTIVLMTGPEIIAGSTRLKAGTATKMCLNMLSTSVMVALGGSYDGLMVDVAPSNAKLRARAIRIIREITGASEEAASRALVDSGESPKRAALMLKAGMGRPEAEAALKEAGGSLREALKKADRG